VTYGAHLILANYDKPTPYPLLGDIVKVTLYSTTTKAELDLGLTTQSIEVDI